MVMSLDCSVRIIFLVTNPKNHAAFITFSAKTFLEYIPEKSSEPSVFIKSSQML